MRPMSHRKTKRSGIDEVGATPRFLHFGQYLSLLRQRSPRPL